MRLLARVYFMCAAIDIPGYFDREMGIILKSEFEWKNINPILFFYILSVTIIYKYYYNADCSALFLGIFIAFDRNMFDIGVTILTI